MPISMPMRRFSNSHFPGFCQFRIEKKEFAVEIKTLHDYPCFFHQIRRFDVFLITARQTLLGIYMFKVDNKSPRTRYETCL